MVGNYCTSYSLINKIWVSAEAFRLPINTIWKLLEQAGFCHASLFLSLAVVLTCQAPPTGPLPSTKCVTRCSGSQNQVSSVSAGPPRSPSGRRRASNSRPSGLCERPSSPSERYSRSYGESTSAWVSQRRIPRHSWQDAEGTRMDLDPAPRRPPHRTRTSEAADWMLNIIHAWVQMWQSN